MKLKDVEILIPTLNNLSSQKLPFRTAYKISKLISKLKEDYSFYIEKAQEILNEYGEKDSQGGFVQFKNGNFRIKDGCEEQAQKEITELRNTDIDDINIIFSLDELDCLEISPEELEPLLPFIED